MRSSGREAQHFLIRALCAHHGQAKAAEPQTERRGSAGRRTRSDDDQPPPTATRRAMQRR